MANKVCVCCKAELNANHQFCPECGAAVATDAVVEPVSVQQPMQQPVLQQPEQMPGKDSKYQPISTWGYIGIFLLMGIPCVGIILMFIWAFGGCRKVNKRNLSRAALVVMLISLIGSLIAGFAIKKTVTEAIESSSIGFLFRGDEKKEEPVDTPEQKETDEVTDEVTDELTFLLGDLLTSELTDVTGGDTDILYGLSDLDALEGLLGDTDSEDLEDLTLLMSMLGDLTGEDSELGGMDLSSLFEIPEMSDGTKEDSSTSWPAELPVYPGGEKQLLEEGRTTYVGTTAEEMFAYVDALKAEGFVYQDFSNLGITEDVMLDKNIWWGTNGSLYLKVNYEEGKVTIEYTTEIPDYEW